MGELAAIVDLTFDSTDLQDASSGVGIYLELVRGMNEIPAVRGEDDTVSALSGRVAYPRVADVLQLELAGVVLGAGSLVDDQRSDYRTLMATLRALLVAASIEPRVLSATLENGSTATINARVVDFQVTERVASQAAEVRVALESVDPDWVITG